MKRPETVTAPAVFPDPLVEGARAVLRRFGHGRADAAAMGGNWSAMWDALRADFAATAGAVPAYAALSAAARRAARHYMTRRLDADRQLELCRAAHEALHAGGIDGAKVEAYAVAREAYEDSVEAFGAARQAVERVLAA